MRERYTLYLRKSPSRTAEKTVPPILAEPPAGESAVLNLMQQAAENFVARLGAAPGAVQLPAPKQPAHGDELRWRNTLFVGPGFRRAHVEWLDIANHFAVVHVVVLPNLSEPDPIFGFDMIAGRTQATGIFLDFSPVTAAPPKPSLGDTVPDSVRAGFTHARTRPDWGSIFSDDFFAIRPANLDEIRAAIGLGATAFDTYLCHLANHATPGPALNKTVREGHAAYARAQRMNPHTERMLARFVGAAPARAFIEDVLFPLPP
jgi:hypothetical protein